MEAFLGYTNSLMYLSAISKSKLLTWDSKGRESSNIASLPGTKTNRLPVISSIKHQLWFNLFIQHQQL